MNPRPGVPIPNPPHLLFSTALVCALALSSAHAHTTPQNFQLRLPQPTTFRVDVPISTENPASLPVDWLPAQQLTGNPQTVEFGRRVVLESKPGVPLQPLLQQLPLVLDRTIRTNLLILQAPDAWSALQAAHHLAALPHVTAAYPVLRRPATLDGPYAPRPNDPHFVPLLGNVVGQWYLENRDPLTGAPLGADLNVRAAWPLSQGQNITIAIADVGVEITHPELSPRANGAPHQNFNNHTTQVLPAGIDRIWTHGTSCAGLALAEGNNAYGMTGVAPLAQLAAWVVFTNRAGNPVLLSDEHLMDAFRFASNLVHIQNHSYSPVGLGQQPRTTLEDAGIEDAIRAGRNGRGVIIIRAAGNDRASGANANDSGYAADPRVITVGAIDRHGRAPSYSEPGACLLVAAPSTERGDNGLFTTDLLESRGAVIFGFFPPFEYLWNFVFNSLGFSGTSAAAPQVAGLAALLLSSNPDLTYRDVQHILLLSARHFDLYDPDLTPNSAGLLVSHNAGFGVPDAGHAVQLARAWPHRPAPVTLTYHAQPHLPIPDGGLRLLITGTDIPPSLASLPCLPSLGSHPDQPTPTLPIVDIGLATNTPDLDLTGHAALVQRGTNEFAEKIARAALAGAEFAVLYNYLTNATGAGCPGGDQLCALGGTDFVPIPAVFISHSHGLALQTLFATNPTARAQIKTEPLTTTLHVPDPLLCEYVGLRVQTDHPLRGDLRITLTSPTGTRSVLQTYGADTNAGPSDWTYYSTHHFLEPSRGPWRVEITDELDDHSGQLLALTLILHGVPIADTDADGLDDAWELAHFGQLDATPRDDPDRDGSSNAREHILGTHPLLPNHALRLDLALWNESLVRLSWPGTIDRTYEVLTGPDPASLAPIATVAGRFPETECFLPFLPDSPAFFQLREIP